MIRIKFKGVLDEETEEYFLEQLNKRGSAVTGEAAELFKDYVIHSYGPALEQHGYVYPASMRSGRLAKSVRARKYRIRVGKELYAYRVQASVGNANMEYAYRYEIGIPEYVEVKNAAYMLFKNQEGQWISAKKVKSREGAGVFTSVIDAAWDEITYMVESKIEGYKKFAGY